MRNTDVIIIGAGACGLMAAWELAKAGKRIEVIEARARPGGRIHTIHSSAFDIPVETGAEFIHGNQQHTIRLLKEFGIRYHKVTGQIWQVQHHLFKKENDFIEDDHSLLEKALKELRKDISVENFLHAYLPGGKHASLKNSVRRFVEGYDAADTSRFSALALKEEWLSDDNDQYRIESGYKELAESLADACLKEGCRIHYSSVVTNIQWEENQVSAYNEGRRHYKAPKAIITIPVGLLKEASKRKGTISFIPEIPHKRQAAQHLGYGNVIKFILQFHEAFWKSDNAEKLAGRNLKNLGFLFSEATIPTWWTQLPDESPVLTGWLGGPLTDKYINADQHTLLKEAIHSLAFIFRMNETELRKMVAAWYISDWTADPFSRGAYSYEVVNGETFKKTVSSPEKNTLYFAGEAFSNSEAGGTVEAALASGLEVAGKFLSNDKTKADEGTPVPNVDYK